MALAKNQTRQPFDSIDPGNDLGVSFRMFFRRALSERLAGGFAGPETIVNSR
jgi:hypothetical protein